MIEKNGIFVGLLMAFVVLIIGIAFLDVSADTTSSMTDTYSITNESITHVLGVANTLTNFPTVAISELRLSNGSAATATTQYNLTVPSTGTLVIGLGNGTYYADYTYRSSSYINDNAARQITGLIPLFFALAILMGVIGYVAWKEFM